jgi:hypothetical protein
MPLEEIHILSGDNTLGMLLKPEGFIRIDGRGLVGHNYETSQKILNWIHEYLKSPAEVTIIIIALEYLNSTSAMILVTVIKEVSQVTNQNKQFFIHWCYEAGDEDILERGQHISEILNIPIDFIRTTDIKLCFKSMC